MAKEVHDDSVRLLLVQSGFKIKLWRPCTQLSTSWCLLMLTEMSGGNLCVNGLNIPGSVGGKWMHKHHLDVDNSLYA